MTTGKWLQQFEDAFRSFGKTFTSEDRDFLLERYSEGLSDAKRQRAQQLIEDFTRFFFKKAISGETFGPIEMVNSEFGKSLEENYSLAAGPFINLAKTYWTFRLQLDDFPPDQYDLLLFQILRNVETDIAGLFFPTPGSMTISVAQRKITQRRTLEEYAPEIDVERFFAENPLLKAGSGRVGCLGMLATILILGYWRA